MEQQIQTTHSAAYKLFHYPFRIWIPQLFLTSLAEKQALPQWTTGNREQDRQAAQQKVAITATIDKMIAFHERGVELEFDSLADVERIYDIILEHIEDNRRYIETSTWLPKEVPFDDLKKMDRFAEKIYLKVRGRIARRAETSVALGALEQECAALVPLNGIGIQPSKVFEEVAQRQYNSVVDKATEVFERRFKGWR